MIETLIMIFAVTCIVGSTGYIFVSAVQSDMEAGRTPKIDFAALLDVGKIIFTAPCFFVPRCFIVAVVFLLLIGLGTPTQTPEQRLEQAKQSQRDLLRMERENRQVFGG